MLVKVISPPSFEGSLEQHLLLREYFTQLQIFNSLLSQCSLSLFHIIHLKTKPTHKILEYIKLN